MLAGMLKLCSLGAVLTLALQAKAVALPFSYAHEHPSYCAELAVRHDDYARSQCVTRAWCSQHWNDDRITRITCDPMRSRADRRLPAPHISASSLASLPDLSETGTRSECSTSSLFPNKIGCGLMQGSDASSVLSNVDDNLLPQGVRAVKLALRAYISLGPFPTTVVKIGLQSGNSGVMSVTWNINGKGSRQTKSARLKPPEINQILAAIDKSDFWRLPHEPYHMGPADGELAEVEVSIGGRKNHVVDAIGDSEAVDSSVLVNAISEIIRAHWKNVPGS